MELPLSEAGLTEDEHRLPQARLVRAAGRKSEEPGEESAKS
jgi:hypothetical protein